VSAGRRLGLVASLLLGVAAPAAPVHAPASGGPGPGRPAFSWWATDGMEKVLPDAPPRRAGAVELFAARNEFEPFQVVLRAGDHDLGAADAEATDLLSAGGARIPRRCLTLYRERYLRLTRPSSVDGGTGEWPDPLLPRLDPGTGAHLGSFPFDLPAGRNRVLWVDVYVPMRTPPGDYRGAMRLTAGGSPLASVPVILHVWPFTLPSTASLRTSFGFSGISALRGHYGRYTDDEDLRALTRRYTEAALRHRISLHGGTMVPPPATFTAAGAQVDWTAYDREEGPLLDGTVFGPAAPLPGARLTSVDVRTPPGYDDRQRVLYWRAWARHFRHRGWLDRLFLYLWDEPPNRDLPAVIHQGELARRADPALHTLLTKQRLPGLDGVVDIWVPLVNFFEAKPGFQEDGGPVPRAAYAADERRGASVWWYQSCSSHGCDTTGGHEFRGWPSYMIDAPPMANRIMPWLAFVYGIRGELYYNTVEAYVTNADPWDDVYAHGGNGDGTLFYPGTPRRLGGATQLPIESIRLELVREGLEDYEYLTLLAQSGRGTLARRWAASLVQHTYEWQQSPSALAAARRAMGEELARSMRAGVN
jgi:Domain of unknown function (DUF4091)